MHHVYSSKLNSADACDVNTCGTATGRLLCLFFFNTNRKIEETWDILMVKKNKKHHRCIFTAKSWNFFYLVAILIFHISEQFCLWKKKRSCTWWFTTAPLKALDRTNPLNIALHCCFSPCNPRSHKKIMKEINAWFPKRVPLRFLPRENPHRLITLRGPERNAVDTVQHLWLPREQLHWDTGISSLEDSTVTDGVLEEVTRLGRTGGFHVFH